MNKLFTIGHSNKSVNELVERLKSFQIDVLVDVRSIPFSLSQRLRSGAYQALEVQFSNHKIIIHYAKETLQISI